jgi:hypothetical protein
MTLHDLGIKHGTDKATHHKYCDFYEENLPKKIDRLLEIGVMDGASLKMWRAYYPDAEIIGVDIKRPQKIDGVKWLQIDATKEAIKELGQFDVIIDDGSHMTADQQKSFELLFEDNLKEGGMYIMEDIHTSFMPSYVNSEETTHAFLKKRDDVTFYLRDKNNIADSFTAIIKK